MTKAAVVLLPQVCRDARDLIPLTQEELASAAEISASTLRRLERGEAISDYAARRIVAALEAEGAIVLGRCASPEC